MSNTFSSQIASDDTLWTFSTDQIEELRSLFANPYEWVKTRVNKTLAPHFVMQFSAFKEAEPSAGFLIQGIDRTALITLRFNPAKMQADLAATGLPGRAGLEDTTEVLDVRLRTDYRQAFSHWDWGTDPNVISDRLMLAVCNPEQFLEDLTSMAQSVTTESGAQPPTPAPEVRAAFILPPGGPQAISYVYEGMEAFFQAAGGDDGDPPPPEDPTTTCSVNTGTFNEMGDPETTVEINTIIVKSYMAEPDPGP